MKTAKRLAAYLTTISLGITSCINPCPKSTQTDVHKSDNSLPLIVGIEGLGGGNFVHGLAAEIAYECAMSQSCSSGDWGHHLEHIQATDYPEVYLIGFSSGANEVRLLAKECYDRKIPVKRLFLLDPTYTSRPFSGQIPENVERTLCFRSTDPDWLVGRALRKEDFVSISSIYQNITTESNHICLTKDKKLREEIIAEIKKARND